jgi:hypothetical protein
MVSLDSDKSMLMTVLRQSLGLVANEEDENKAVCTSCTQVAGKKISIIRGNGSKHLLSAQHQQRKEMVQRITEEETQHEHQAVENVAILESLQDLIIVHRPRPPAVSGAHSSQTALLTISEREMYAEYYQEDILFSAGLESELSDALLQMTLLEELKERKLDLLLAPDDSDLAQEDIPEQDLVEEIISRIRKLLSLIYCPSQTSVLYKIGMNEETPVAPDEENIMSTLLGEERPIRESDWVPYPSKTWFMLHLLNNLPRQRISETLMRAFLWVMTECGAKDVPSFDAFKKFEDGLQSSNGIPSIKCQSTKGNIFYVNDLRTIIAHDYANPLLRPYLHFYPEIPDGPISEFWHGDKWRKEMDFDLLTPMWVQDESRHFYVNELTLLRNGSLVIPIRWVIFKGVMHADCYKVELNEASETVAVAQVLNNHTVLISSDDMSLNYFDLERDNLLPEWHSDSVEFSAKMPNPLRELADGAPLYSSFVDLFWDDVSGNRSKSYNKHYNCYATHRNIERRLLQQEFNVHFIVSSPDAPAAEQAEKVKELIEQTHSEPVEVYDCEIRSRAKIRIFPNTSPTDNPMGSEIAAHIGAKGNYSCRKCMVGGIQAQKRTDPVYHAMFEPGEPRRLNTIKQELNYQIDLACRGVESKVDARWTTTGIKDAYTTYWTNFLLSQFKEIKKSEPHRTSESIYKEVYEWVLNPENREKILSPFLRMKGYDPTKDTPIEILHTILLGVLKYVWHGTHSKWNATQKAAYALHLQATDTSGLSIPPIRSNYIMQYANSLIGRQFKQVAQASVFHVYDLVDDLHFKAWKALGDLCPLLWYPEIDNLEQYISDVKTAVANLLDILCMIDPSKILTKNKLHILSHVEEDIRRSGPLLGCATEIFECFNAVFRFCSIFSNHLAPSRDIAMQLSGQEQVKHIVTGGFWRNRDGQWEQASPAVRDFLHTNSMLQGLLGWSEAKGAEPGLQSLDIIILKH